MPIESSSSKIKTLSNKDAANERLNWLVYIIRTQNGALYTGITNNIERRSQQHAQGKGAKFFRTNQPIAVVWTEANHNRSSASRREYEIKRMRRAQKLALIDASNCLTLPIGTPCKEEKR